MLPGVFYLLIVLSFALQRPLLVGLAILAVWLLADQARLRRSTPWRWFRRRSAVAKLRQQLALNPHNRDARFGLAEHLVGRGQADKAYGMLEKNLAAGDDDDETLTLAGKAAFASSRDDAAQRGEQHLDAARTRASSFRRSTIDLELGRGRLRHGRFEQARAALESSIVGQPGSVEAHVLLSQSYAGLGEAGKADEARAHAWRLYKEAPLFRRGAQRPWAWRAKPSAAVAYYGAVAALVVMAVLGLRALTGVLGATSGYFAVDGMPYATEEEGFDLNADAPAPASRFEVSVGDTPDPRANTVSLIRWDLNRNGVIDRRHRTMPGDLWCRALTHYPDLEPGAGNTVYIEDAVTGARVALGVLGGAYTGQGLDASVLDATAFAFESLLQSTPPRDCDAAFRYGDSRFAVGVRDGEPYGDLGM